MSTKNIIKFFLGATVVFATVVFSQPHEAKAAVNLVQSQTGECDETAPCTMSYSGSQAGDLIVVMTNPDDVTNNVISDSAGDTYYGFCTGSVGGGQEYCLYYAYNVPAGITSITNGSNGQMTVGEYSGVATSSPLESSNATPATGGSESTSYTGGNITAEFGGELLVGGLLAGSTDGACNAPGLVPSGGWSVVISNGLGSRGRGSVLLENILSPSAAGTYSNSGTSGNSCSPAILAASFRAAPSSYTGSGVTLDSVGPNVGGTSVVETSPMTWTHVTSGSNPFLTVSVAVGWNGDSALSLSATYAGVAMTSAGRVETGGDDDGFEQMFYLVNPDLGSHTVSVTLSGGSAYMEGGSVSFDNVDPTNPIATIKTNYGDGTTATDTVATALGHMVVDGIANGSPIDSSNEILKWENNQNGYTGAGNGAQSTAPGVTGSVTMGYTVNNDIWGMIAMDLNPVGTVPGPSPALVQNSSSTGTDSVTCPLSPTQAGDLLVVNANVNFENINTAGTFSDTEGDTFVKGNNGNNSAGNVSTDDYIWNAYAYNIAAGSTGITVTDSGGGSNMYIECAEFSGVAKSTDPFEAGNWSSSNSATAYDSGPITVPGNALLVSGMNERDGVISTPSSPWTTLDQYVWGSQGVAMAQFDQLDVGAGTYDSNGTVASMGPAGWKTNILAFEGTWTTPVGTNISATSTSHWAWNDDIGWIDFFDTNVINVSNSGVSGYASSSVGYISLDCNTSPNGDICGSPSTYQVLNDGAGDLTGWAWNDNIGWISFCGGAGTSACPGTHSYQVTIDSSGNFQGWAWNDTVGWIDFNCDNAADSICGTSSFKVETSWGATSGITGSATSTGVLDSATFDTGESGGAQINSILWQGTQPGGTTVEFQLAASAASSGPWTYTGPDGTGATYYVPSAPGTSLPVSYTLYNDLRYFRYRVTLIGAGATSPTVNNVIVNWSP